MSQYLWQSGDLITAARLNANSYNLFKGVAGFEDTIQLADNVAGTVVLQPTTDPVSPVQLFQVKNQAGTVKAAISSDGSSTFSTATATGRLQWNYGASVASANNLTLGTDGNAFPISLGVSPINLLETLNWQAGSEVLLVFTGTVTVKHNIANSGTLHGIKLAGALDFNAIADCTLRLVNTGTVWIETAREDPRSPTTANQTFTGLTTITGRITANVVGASAKPLLNFVPLIPALNRTTAGLLANTQADIPLHASVPSSAVAVAVGVSVTGWSSGLVDIQHIAAESSTYPLQIPFASGYGSGIVPCVSASPCTIGYVYVGVGTISIVLSVAGYWEAT